MQKFSVSRNSLRAIGLSFAITATVIGAALLLPPAGKPSVPAWALGTHVSAAILSLFLGGWVLYRPKGTAAHKFAGKIWVVLMLAAAFSSFFIQSWGRFSPIHIFSVWTPISLGIGIYSARKGNIVAHRSYLKGAYFGLIGAGVLAFALPGRFLWHTVLGG